MSYLGIYLNWLGCSATDISVFSYIYQYGPKAVSTIAKASGLDRSYCYKVINNLVKIGLIQESNIKNTKNYFCPSQDVFKEALHRKQQDINWLENIIEEVNKELSEQTEMKAKHIPKLTVFSDNEGIQHLFNDIKRTIVEEHILGISFLASRVFETQVQKYIERNREYNSFWDFIENKKILIDSTIAEGFLTLDTLHHIDDIKNIREIQPGCGSVHLYLVWSYIYIIQRGKNIIALKLWNTGLLSLLRILMKQAKTE